jgi:hypothetical protein
MSKILVRLLANGALSVLGTEDTAGVASSKGICSDDQGGESKTCLHSLTRAVTSAFSLNPLSFLIKRKTNSAAFSPQGNHTDLSSVTYRRS